MTIYLWWRRMQDIGKSGWWCVVPGYNLYLASQPSEMRENRFGKIPNTERVDDNLLWKKISLGIIGFAGLLFFVGVIFCGDAESGEGEGVTQEDVDMAYIDQYCHEIEMHLAPVVGKKDANEYIKFMRELDLNEAQWRDICTRFLTSVAEDKAKSGLEVNAVMRFCRDLNQLKYQMSPEGKAEAAKKEAEEKEAEERRKVEVQKLRRKEAIDNLCAEWRCYDNTEAFCDLVEGLKISDQSMIDLGRAVTELDNAASSMSSDERKVSDKVVEREILGLSSEATDDQVKKVIEAVNDEKKYYQQRNELSGKFMMYRYSEDRARPVIKSLGRKHFLVINEKLHETVFGKHQEMTDRQIKKILNKFYEIKTEEDAEAFIEFMNAKK